jgi:hypothetical protein
LLWRSVLEEADMVSAPNARSARQLPIEGATVIAPVRATSFGWSLAKIRVACFVLVGVAAPAAAGLAVSVSFVRWLCLAWLIGLALLMHCLDRRACAETPVLSVDERGILDRRLMSRHIEWREIGAICPVDAGRNHVVDIELRWPKATLADTRWPVRIGAYCQMGYGVPAVSISMLLLDGGVSDLLKAVAQYRPDLLHHLNRSSLAAHP